MSEIDRLSNSGLYPALPMAEKGRRREPDGGRPQGGRGGRAGAENSTFPSRGDAPGSARPATTRIDEYA